jgi:hypothetical protein
VGLTVLCAGCSPEERERATLEVKRALGAKSASDAWRVSLVKVKTQWMVTLDAPAAGFRGLTFPAPDAQLSESIAEAVSGGSAPGAEPHARGAVAPAAHGERRDRHACPNCRGSFVVVYESEAGEPQDDAPVACPYCWTVSRVPVGRTAALSRDYRAEREPS